MKKAWSMKKNAEAVSPVIATILMVAITVVLAAVLYVMVLGFGGTGTTAPTTSLVKKTPAPSYGVKYEFVSPSKEVSWTDLSIQLNDGTNTVSWAPTKEDLDGGTSVTWAGGAKTLGSLSVYCNITDLVGNGNVNGGDYFTFTTPSSPTFSVGTTYYVSIIYDVTADKIYDTTFTG